MEGSSSGEPVRLAELMAALSLATDLGLGRPLEHELGVCLAAVELADRLGCDAQERSDVYYLALLAHIGCTGIAADLASWVGGDEIHFQAAAQRLGFASSRAEDLRFLVTRVADDRPLPERARRVASMVVAGERRDATMTAGLCEGGAVLAHHLRLPEPVARSLGQLLERWDGEGAPGEAAGDALPRPLRIVHVAHDLVGIARARDPAAAIAAVSRRRGRGYDPAVADAALAAPLPLLETATAAGAWERVIDAEPPPLVTMSAAGLMSVARAFGEFADVKVGFLAGHSARVAGLAATASASLGCPRAEVEQVRAAGLVHDVGRAAIANGIWDKPGALGAGEWERVRLHPYLTERVLERSGALAALAPIAGAHHERLDGSGYHRRATGAQLGVGARVLAAADVYDALVHERPHRAALTRAAARTELGAMVSAGALEQRSVNAVLEAVGVAPLAVRRPHPAGLSDREVEVLALVAQGRTSREIARILVITEKTAGHHIEHIYAKLGVSTRVGAALFAMRHDLVD